MMIVTAVGSYAAARSISSRKIKPARAAWSQQGQCIETELVNPPSRQVIEPRLRFTPSLDRLLHGK